MAGESAELLPEFKEGETLTIQRNVNGKNVLMTVIVSEKCCILSLDRMVLTARMGIWSESPYADGRVDTQRRSIDRLLYHLLEHCTDPACPSRQLPDDEK